MWVVIVLFAALFAGGAAINAHNNYEKETAHLKQEVRYLKAHKKPQPKTLDGIEFSDLEKGDHNE